MQTSLPHKTGSMPTRWGEGGEGPFKVGVSGSKRRLTDAGRDGSLGAAAPSPQGGVRGPGARLQLATAGAGSHNTPRLSHTPPAVTKSAGTFLSKWPVVSPRVPYRYHNG